MPTKKKPAAPAVDHSAHISMRIHADVVRRLEALIPAVGASSALCPTGKADRTDVIRHALEAGLDVLEKRLGEPRRD